MSDQDQPLGFDQSDIDRIARAVQYTERLGPISNGGKSDANRSQQELIMVAIIGTENGGGYYKGSICYGTSNGGEGSMLNQTAGYYNFQLQSSTNQTQVDGPAPLLDSSNNPINNCLVANIMEPFVNGTHLLYGSSSQTEYVYVFGRIMGVTNEATPRTIVYVDTTPLFPCICKITGPYSTSNGGVYYGRIVQGQFVSGSNFGYSFQLSSLNSAYLPSQANCWITNNWEQQFATGAGNAITTGTYVWGIVCGYPTASTVADSNTSANNVWYQVYTWLPTQSPTLTYPVQNITTGQTANSSYGLNEQTMLDNLKTDVTNLHNSLNDLVNKLTATGYIA